MTPLENFILGQFRQYGYVEIKEGIFLCIAEHMQDLEPYKCHSKSRDYSEYPYWVHDDRGTLPVGYETWQQALKLLI